MRQHEKRRRRVEILIDQRMLSFLKPVATGPTLPRRKRDSLDFLTSAISKRSKSIDQPTDKAS